MLLTHKQIENLLDDSRGVINDSEASLTQAIMEWREMDVEATQKNIEDAKKKLRLVLNSLEGIEWY
jgi:hypothetical protein